MRLLQVNLRGLLLYAIVLVLISIPVSLLSIQAILREEVDESISRQADEFMEHIKNFEYLEDLEPDLEVFDQLSYNIDIKPAHEKSFKEHYNNISAYDSISNENKPFRQLESYVTIKDKPYILTVQMSQVDNEELITTVAMVQIALSILLVAGLLILNRSLSKRLWRPFYKTIDQLKAYDLDKSEHLTFEKSNINEFDDLNKTVSHLTERNRKVYINQREFIENASHELQTPIAIFQSKLDALMQSPALAKSDADTLTDLEATAQRMARLNKNLLLLSKIDNEQFMNKEEVDVASMVITQLDSLKPVGLTDNIGIETSISPLIITANRTMIEVLLTNLFHNSIRHSRKSEPIKISLHDKTLTIVNTGVNHKLDFDKVIRRFVKQTDNSLSTGLGLAIVNKICDSCGFQLLYDYENGAHKFSVVF